MKSLSELFSAQWHGFFLVWAARDNERTVTQDAVSEKMCRHSARINNNWFRRQIYASKESSLLEGVSTAKLKRLMAIQNKVYTKWNNFFFFRCVRVYWDLHGCIPQQFLYSWIYTWIHTQTDTYIHIHTYKCMWVITNIFVEIVEFFYAYLIRVNVIEFWCNMHSIYKGLLREKKKVSYRLDQKGAPK